MMRSTFGGLEVARRALFAMQTTQQTTAHNIANANTKGYTRQVVNLVASRPIEAPGLMRSNIPGQLGQGVQFDSINRIREKFLDDQYYHENMSLGEWSIRSDTLDKLEAIMNEPSDSGIRQTLEAFWNSWQELSKEPDNMTHRILVKERALALTDAFNHTARKLNDLSSDLTESIQVKTIQSNSILQQITALNNEIFRIEGLGNNANDLRDQRDLLIDELSLMINVTVTENDDGYYIRMGNTELVTGRTQSTELTAELFESSLGTELTSGEIYGLIVSRDQYVTNYINNLNEIAAGMVQGEVEVTLDEGMMLPPGVTVEDINGVSHSGTLTAPITIVVNGINGLHQLGYTLNGTAGDDFFTMTAGSEALSFAVNPDIVNDVSLIAASGKTYTDGGGDVHTVRGNNQLALIMAGLRNKQVAFNSGESASIDEYLRSMIGKLGVESQEAKRQTSNQLILVDQVELNRQAVSGVSLDEEMTNMIMYQHSYNAAARMMTTYDQMLDRIINQMGIVGR